MVIYWMKSNHSLKLLPAVTVVGSFDFTITAHVVYRSRRLFGVIRTTRSNWLYRPDVWRLDFHLFLPQLALLGGRQRKSFGTPET